MKIEIHLRDTNHAGKRVGADRKIHLESCRVYKEAGDGLRLDNLAIPAYGFFHEKSKEFIAIARGGDK